VGRPIQLAQEEPDQSQPAQKKMRILVFIVKFSTLKQKDPVNQAEQDMENCLVTYGSRVSAAAHLLALLNFTVAGDCSGIACFINNLKFSSLTQNSPQSCEHPPTEDIRIDCPGANPFRRGQEGGAPH
jgi:hypothetical protein